MQDRQGSRESTSERRVDKGNPCAAPKGPGSSRGVLGNFLQTTFALGALVPVVGSLGPGLSYGGGSGGRGHGAGVEYVVRE